MDDLKVSIVQSDVIWENPERNRKMFSEKILQIKEKTDLIILPEMFNSGFTMNPEAVAENENGKTILWMKKMAIKKKCVVTGSLIIKEEKRIKNKINVFYYNRLIWQNPDGTTEIYNKKHLFRFANEHKKYSPGKEKLIVEINKEKRNGRGWKICPMICYDLRFPVWCRNSPNKINNNGKKTGTGGLYELLIFVASWPGHRSYAWKTLLKARAIENQCYVIGVNRIGTDGNGISYSGDSVVINPMGETISKTKAFQNSVETVTLSANTIEEWRKNFPAWMDSDAFDFSA